jgi:hypothetical protein
MKRGAGSPFGAASPLFAVFPAAQDSSQRAHRMPTEKPAHHGVYCRAPFERWSTEILPCSVHEEGVFGESTTAATLPVMVGNRACHPDTPGETAPAHRFN